MRRVGVRIERPAEPPPLPEPVASLEAAPLSDWGRSIIRKTAGVGPGGRIVAGVLGAIALRSFAVLSSLAPVGSRGSSIVAARLPALALAFVLVAAAIGGMLSRKRTESDWRDLVSATFAGGLFGLLIAAVDYALIRSVELPLGPWSSSLVAVEVVWAVLGAALAGLSCLLIPYNPELKEAAR